MERFGRRALVLAAFGLAACARVLEPEPPGVQLTGVRLVEAALLEQTVELDLRLTNPNPLPLSASGLTFDLDVAGRDLAAGASNDRIDLPAGGTADVTLTTATTLGNLGAQLLSFAETGGVDYRLQGAIYLDLLGNRPLPFTLAGTLALVPGRGLTLVPR